MMPSTGPFMTMRFHQTQTVLSVEDEVIRMRVAECLVLSRPRVCRMMWG